MYITDRALTLISVTIFHVSMYLEKLSLSLSNQMHHKSVMLELNTFFDKRHRIPNIADVSYIPTFKFPFKIFVYRNVSLVHCCRFDDDDDIGYYYYFVVWCVYGKHENFLETVERLGSVFP